MQPGASPAQVAPRTPASEGVDDVVVGLCTGEKIEGSSGRRYLRARRPELHGTLVQPTGETPVIDSGWGVVKR